MLRDFPDHALVQRIIEKERGIVRMGADLVTDAVGTGIPLGGQAADIWLRTGVFRDDQLHQLLHHGKQIPVVQVECAPVDPGAGAQLLDGKFGKRSFLQKFQQRFADLRFGLQGARVCCFRHDVLPERLFLPMLRQLDPAAVIFYSGHPTAPYIFCPRASLRP